MSHVKPREATPVCTSMSSLSSLSTCYFVELVDTSLSSALCKLCVRCFWSSSTSSNSLAAPAGVKSPHHELHTVDCHATTCV